MRRIEPARLALIGCVCAGVLAASGALAAPPSLRETADVHDLGDAFMRSVVAGNPGAAYRGLARHWPLRAEQLGSEIVGAEKRRASRRSQLGLSMGYELVAAETAGEHAMRLTYLERFDRGGLVWRLLFFRPESVWLVESVSQADDLNELFHSSGPRKPVDSR